MKKYEFTGSMYGKSIITIDNDTLTIEHKGTLSFMSKGLIGKKTIKISQISATQYKKFGITNGYLQFVIIGSQESKKGLNEAQHDENTVLWAHKKQNAYAEEIIDYINNYNNSNNQIKNSEDKYDKLAKIKKLLDDGTISLEEFETEKQKILK